MKFRLLLPLLALSLSACSTVAPSQGYRPAGSMAPPLQISGELFDFTNVKISIDGRKVVDERLSIMTGDGEFHSTFDGKQVAVSCTTSTGLMASATRCLVFINNEKAATLSF